MPAVSLSKLERHFPVEGHTDVVVVQGAARRLAAQLGFPEQAQWEIAIAVSEVATNIVKYTPGGVVLLRCRQDGGRVCFEFEAVDRGEGLEDIEMAKRDGVSQGCDLTTYEGPDRPHSLGTGLGAIHRLMDRVTIENCDSGGLSVRAQKDLRDR